MKLKLSINNTIHNIDCDEQETLLTILRSLHFTSVKCGCQQGLCGSCTILLDNKIVPSCLIPVGSVEQKNIVTLEHFALSDDYKDIIQGLEKANIHLCGYCNAGKIFTIHEIIESEEYPNRNLIEKRMKNLSCMCTNIETLIDGIFKAYDIRYERRGRKIYGRK